MFNFAIPLRKANAIKECGNDVRELRSLWGGFGKLCVPLEKSWLCPCLWHSYDNNKYTVAIACLLISHNCSNSETTEAAQNRPHTSTRPRSYAVHKFCIFKQFLFGLIKVHLASKYFFQ